MRVGFFEDFADFAGDAVDWAADDAAFVSDFALDDFPVDDFDVFAADDALMTLPTLDPVDLTLPDYAPPDWTVADQDDMQAGVDLRTPSFTPPTGTDAGGFFNLNALLAAGGKVLDFASAKAQRDLAQSMGARNPSTLTQRAGYPATMYAPGSPQYNAAVRRAATATSATPWYKRPEIVAAGIGLIGVLLTVGASRRTRKGN